MTITEFLEARIDEDEARAASGWSHLGDSRWETDNYGRDFLTPSAVLAECAAKRAIIELSAANRHHLILEIAVTANAPLRALAAVYKGHPDYRQEWAL